MAAARSRKLFVNLAVKDLERSKGFFTKLGFEFDPQFTEALSCDSRAEVDEMVRKAVSAGGERAMDPQDHGFMYGWSFYDPDGYHWEVLPSTTG
jgi:predicted lactoylglutathione lyase